MSFALHTALLVTSLLAIADSRSPTSPATKGLVIDGQWSNRNSIVETPEAPAAAMHLRPIEPRTEEAWDPRWAEVMAVAREDERPLETSASDLSDFVSKQIQQSVDQGKQRSGEDNFDRLSRLSRRLSNASSQQGVDEIANFLSGLVGSRATEPIQDPAGKSFDVQTAQIDRVHKETDLAGKTHYIATMIDRQGVTMEIELDRETGAQLYKVMKLIESNPLLEQVYRKIVMGFLDQALKDSSPDSQNSDSRPRPPGQPLQSETR